MTEKDYMLEKKMKRHHMSKFEYASVKNMIKENGKYSDKEISSLSGWSSQQVKRIRESRSFPDMKRRKTEYDKNHPSKNTIQILANKERKAIDAAKKADKELEGNQLDLMTDEMQIGELITAIKALTTAVYCLRAQLITEEKSGNALPRLQKCLIDENVKIF